MKEFVKVLKPLPKKPAPKPLFFCCIAELAIKPCRSSRSKLRGEFGIPKHLQNRKQRHNKATNTPNPKHNTKQKEHGKCLEGETRGEKRVKKPAPKPRPTTVSDVGETKRTEKEKTNDEGKKRQDEENRGNEEEKKRHDAEKKRHDAMKRTVETAKDAEKKGNDEAEKNGGKRTREEIHDSDGSGDSGDEEDESPKVLAVEGDAKVVKSEDGFLG